MTDPTDVLERAQAWLQAAKERGINMTDENGYLAVIADLSAEVEFQRTALQGYRNEQLRMVDVRGEDQAEISRLRGTLEQLRRENERAWKEVDIIARERDQHARWRHDLADKLDEVERHRDALGVALTSARTTLTKHSPRSMRW